MKEEGAADQPFDLLLTVTEGNAYYGCNGGATDEDGTLVTYGRYGSISVHGGSTAKVTVELVDPTTGGKVIVPNFYLSFYDLDGDGDGDAYKSIELADYESVTLSSPTNVVVDDAGTTFRACGVATDCGAATAADGTTENLPTEPSSASPLELTAEQLARTATFMFADVSTLTFVLRTGTAQGGDPLSFLFGGASALVAACDAAAAAAGAAAEPAAPRRRARRRRRRRSRRRRRRCRRTLPSPTAPTESPSASTARAATPTVSATARRARRAGRWSPPATNCSNTRASVSTRDACST